MTWWHRDVTAAGKLPLILLFLAFIVTWVTVRQITRSIRSGRGDFHNVSAGGIHLHHSIPGIILLTIGAVAAVGLPGHAPWRETAAVVIGVGTSLVFDEFAMILHLRDDYWQSEGRQSTEAVGLVAACLGLGVIGFSPFGVDDIHGSELAARLVAVALIALTFGAVVVCAMKGKYRLALIAVFVWPIAMIGAVRLARHGSRWDRRRYTNHPTKQARAAARTAKYDARWDPRWRRLADALGGKPDVPDA